MTEETDTPTDDARIQVLIRAWAECRTDLEMELGLPADQRNARIEALIAERTAELAKQAVEATKALSH